MFLDISYLSKEKKSKIKKGVFDLINFNELTKANIYLRNDLAGQLEKVSSRKFIFRYNKDWITTNKKSIGLNFPIGDKNHESEELFPFFDNLIPEGWLLDYVQGIYKIDGRNRFALLLATGRETMGAIRILALDENSEEVSGLHHRKNSEQDQLFPVTFPSSHERCPYCLQKLTHTQLKKAIAHNSCIAKMWRSSKKIKIRLNTRESLNSFRQTIYGASISGVQKKGLFKLEKGLLYPSQRDAHYIIKPQGSFTQLPENEHVTMSIARAIGFKVPPLSIFKVEDKEDMGMMYAIKCFNIGRENYRLRLEDLAQVSGVPNEEKYHGSYERLGKVIYKYSDAPVIDIFEMWKRLLFSFFIGNGDMHLKNWSFLELEEPESLFKLSPCYDFLNTRVPLHDEESDLALTLCGKKNKIKKDDFISFAQRFKIEHLTEQIISQLDMWMETTNDLVQCCFLKEDLKERYLNIVEGRYQVLKGRQTDYL